MRKFVIALSVISFIPSSVSAQEICSKGRADLLNVQGYEISTKESSWDDETYIALTTTLANNSGRGIRMAEGTIVFQDVLGRIILVVGIDPDLQVESGKTVVQEGVYSNDRLLNVAKEDILVSTCVRGLVYSDGQVFTVGEK